MSDLSNLEKQLGVKNRPGKSSGGGQRKQQYQAVESDNPVTEQRLSTFFKNVLISAISAMLVFGNICIIDIWGTELHFDWLDIGATLFNTFGIASIAIIKSLTAYSTKGT